MAALFPLRSTVVRRAVETIDLSVVANSEGEAIAKAAQVLEKFPQPHTVPDVPYCYVSHREPTEPEIVDIQIVYPEEGDSA